MRLGLLLCLGLSTLAHAETEAAAKNEDQTAVEKSETSDASSEARPSLDIIVGGQHESISLGLHGNFPVTDELYASLGAATTSIGSANLLDLKIGLGTEMPKPMDLAVWSRLFFGQTQILTEEPIGLGKSDSRFWFLEGLIGIGPIGVGYRFNFMRDEDGIYVRKTLIPRNLMFPFLAITTRL